MYKYYAFDLDGTLLNSEKIITPATLRQVKSARRNGASVILISSRHYSEMVRYSVELELDEKDYIISCDGQYIRDGKGKILKQFDFLSTKDVKRIFELIGCRMSFFTDEYDYSYGGRKADGIKKIKTAIKEKKHIKTGNDGRKWGEIRALRLYNFLQIEKIVLPEEASIDGLEEEYSILHVSARYEVFNKQVGKYKALYYIAENYGIDLNNLLYFGDDLNDLKCFKNLPHTVAMGNAAEEIKALAGSITDDCDNDGVGKIVEKVQNEM